MNETLKRQNSEIWKWMLVYGSITQRQAGKELDIWRLSARIYDLKEAGFPIRSEWATVGTRYGKQRFKRYFIDEKKLNGMIQEEMQK